MSKPSLTIAALLALYAVPGQASDLGWLSGHWCGTQGKSQIEEYWSSPQSNGLIGLARSVRDGKMSSFEYMRVELAEQGSRLVAQPGGKPPTLFPLLRSEATAVTFHNPEHDFPQTIRYWREGETLQAEISGPNGQGGEQKIGFSYRRCDHGK